MATHFLPATLQITDDVISQEINKEYVLLNMVTEKYYSLNEVGTRFWQLLSAEQDGSVESALTKLLAEYNVEEAVLREDIAKLLEQLKSEKLVSF